MKKLIISVFLLLVGCMPTPEVEVTELSKVLSPNRSHELLIVRQEPGATDGYSIAVYLRKASAKGLGKRIFVVKGEPPVEVKWSDENHAVVLCAANKRDVFSGVEKVGSVSISYPQSE